LPGPDVSRCIARGYGKKERDWERRRRRRDREEERERGLYCLVVQYGQS